MVGHSVLSPQPSALLTRDFVLTCIGGFLLFSSFQILLGMLPLYLKEDLGGSDSTVGLIIGVFAFAALFPRPFIGREIDRSGSKRFLIAGSIIFIAASSLYLLADSIPILLSVRVLHGIGMACFHTAAFTFIASLAPDHRRGEAMGVWGLMSTFSTAIAPYLGLQIRDWSGNTTVFLTSVGIAMSGLAMVLLVREPRKGPRAPAVPGGLFERAVLIPAIIVLLFTFSYGAVTSFVLLYADEQNIANKGLYFTGFAAAVLFSRVLGGRVSDRHGRWAVIIPSLVLAIAAMFVLSIVSSLVLLLTAAALFGLSFGIGNPATTALAIDLVRPERRGAGMATYTSAFEAGIGSGSIVMGIVASFTGYASMFALCAIFPAVALVVGLTAMRSTQAARPA